MSILSLPSPADTAPTPTPLTPEQLELVAQATMRSKKLRRAQIVATLDTGFTACCALTTLLCGIFSLTALLLGLALSLTALNGYRGLRLLKRWDLRAPRILALNQLLLAGLVTLYALFCIYDASIHPPFTATTNTDPELNSLLQPYEHLTTKLVQGFYLAVIVGTLLTQGFTAVYYWSRQKHLRAYLTETPDWILQLQTTLLTR